MGGTGYPPSYSKSPPPPGVLEPGPGFPHHSMNSSKNTVRYIVLCFANSNSNSEISICSTRGARKFDILTVSQHNFYVYVNSPIPIPKSASAQHGAPQNVTFWWFHNITFMFMLIRQFQFNSHCILVKAVAGEMQRCGET